jgi:hypothetical protein
LKEIPYRGKPFTEGDPLEIEPLYGGKSLMEGNPSYRGNPSLRGAWPRDGLQDK